ncbi:MAG: endonuclease/exonuclease/phosphatase family protein [Pseudomonadota bacterium]
MKIVALNAWGGRLNDALLPYLAAEAPDILCLQEVVVTNNPPGPWLTYRDGDHVLAQRANVLADVAGALPHHTAIFCPSAQGTLLADGDEEIFSQWGIATFIHPRLTLIGQAQHFVHKDFSANGYGEHPRSRTAHAVRVHDPAGRTVTVAHMHGLRDLAGKHDTPARTRQAHRFRDLIAPLPADIRVLCGDFNVLPGSATLKILERAGFTELVTANGHTSTRTSLYEKPVRFADYMLINRIDAVRTFTVVTDPEVSDHCPLRLTI